MKGGMMDLKKHKGFLMTGHKNPKKGKAWCHVCLKGKDTKSNPTNLVSAIPGPGEIWLLDRWDFEALNLSYDLQNVKRRNYGVWTPQDLSVSITNDLALITYPSYNYFEVFKLSNPYDIE